MVDLYAGIGYFTVPLLVRARARCVHACEWNADALEWNADALEALARRNLLLNGGRMPKVSKVPALAAAGEAGGDGDGDGFRVLSRARRVVFLDVDGVLHPFDAVEECKHFDPARMARLARICSEGAAEVILSSSWRTVPEAEARVRAALSAVGVAMAGATGRKTKRRRMPSTSRCRCILEWLGAPERAEEAEVAAWVVLDDLNLTDPRILPHFVRTDSATGLTDGDVERAVRLLRGDGGGDGGAAQRNPDLVEWARD